MFPEGVKYRKGQLRVGSGCLGMRGAGGGGLRGFSGALLLLYVHTLIKSTWNGNFGRAWPFSSYQLCVGEGRGEA